MREPCRVPLDLPIAMINPFAGRYATCNTGAPAAKHAVLSDGPIIVDIEPVGLCNFRCVMCPTGLHALGRPGGFMTRETHNAILEKTAPFKSSIRYIGWGEPLMHTQISWFIDAASHDGRLTHLNTNGSKFITDQTVPARLVSAGLSSIKFSFQGADRETYHAMRRVDFFEELLFAIDMMRNARGWNYRPFIAASTTTTTESEETIARFKSRIAPMVDQLTIGKTVFEFIDMAAVQPKQRALLEEAAQHQTVDKRHPDPCPEVYNKLTIHWDGAVRVCCNDYSGTTDLGNIVTDDFADIWRHPTIEAYRERLGRKEYSGPLCGVCYDYADLTGKLS